MSGFERATPATDDKCLEHLEAARANVEASLEYALKLAQAARNLLAALTPEGEVERLAARELVALLEAKEKDNG